MEWDERNALRWGERRWDEWDGMAGCVGRKDRTVRDEMGGMGWDGMGD